MRRRSAGPLVTYDITSGLLHDLFRREGELKTAVRFKSPQIALKELKPFILDGRHIRTGKQQRLFHNLRPRELLANWLLCSVINHSIQPGRLDFLSDPRVDGCDGLILDTLTGQLHQMEHVIAFRRDEHADLDGKGLILKAIEQKVDRGADYAAGKTLVVFPEGAGEWVPREVRTAVPASFAFDALWVIGRCSLRDDEYAYNVVRLRPDPFTMWRVTLDLHKDDPDWSVA